LLFSFGVQHVAIGQAEPHKLPDLERGCTGRFQYRVAETAKELHFFDRQHETALDDCAEALTARATPPSLGDKPVRIEVWLALVMAPGLRIRARFGARLCAKVGQAIYPRDRTTRSRGKLANGTSRERARHDGRMLHGSRCERRRSTACTSARQGHE
jgi:hypothetical protein